MTGGATDDRLRAALAILHDGVLALDARGRVEALNPAAARIFGYAADELIGEDIALLIAGPDGAAELLARSVETGDARGTGVARELTGRRKDGAVFPIELALTRGERDGQAFFAGVVRDISERKRVEQALRASEERFRRLVETCPGMLHIHDARGGGVYFSPKSTELIGWTPAELLAEFRWWIHPDDRPRIETIFTAIFNEQRAFRNLEFKGIRKDGSVWWGQATGVPLHDPDGTFIGIVVQTLDVTDRKASEEALLRARQSADAANAAKSRFVANMSHEIRTPLNAVLGLTELLLGTSLSDHQRDYIAKIQGAGEHLLALVGGVLDLSKIESGNLTLERIAFEPRALIAGGAELFSDAAQRKGLRFEHTVAPEVPHTCVGDPTRIRQVLANLLSNAVRFTDAGEIRVEVGYAGGKLRCSVRDTGTGIPQDKLVEVFEPFQQLDSSIARRYGGTGLGLAICTNLVQFMGGTMEAESELGRGSRFTFEIPLEAADEPPAPPAVEAAPVTEAPVREAPAPEAEPPSVLIAEDHALNRMVVEAFLKELGFRVESVEDGRAAVEAYTAASFDLVLMDVQMPVLDGLGATREIRALERAEGRTPAVILALTAGAFADDVAACMDAGCDGHLAKPLHRPTLREKIRQALASRGRALA